MADNKQAGAAVGSGPTFATDEIAGIDYPRAKVSWGVDGTAVDASATNPLPVVQTGTPALPTGAATAAKQPALGTAGTASSDVISVQGIASGTALAVSAASLPLPSGASTEATLTAQSAKLPASLGQKAMTASMAVVLASDQASVPVAATLAAETTKVIGTVNVAASQTIATTNAGVFAVQAGQAAHDAAIASNPVRVAGRGMLADYAAVATGDTADLLASLLGKLVILTDALPANTWAYAAAAGGLVNTTGVTAKAAAGAGIRNYVSKAQIMNSHQTIGSEVVIRDGAAGTVLWRGWAQFTGGGAEVEFKPPLRGTANTLIEIAEVTATATAGILVNLQGFVAAE